ncbi:SDR family oxidoreductase [Labilibaculum manganireducens]|uniref:SDR family NAD(P)-dependent oxidoreductase n=1 Tax=Labilibaculum manganireducens TaxID=1940525 RepID=UPI0029F49495|nr:SDR family oxidoreductase [Labilibaculum manganireducens]
MIRFIKNKIKQLIVKERLVPIYISKDSKSLLNGKTALISGGSSGIGFAIAKKLSNSGCKVIISGRNVEKLQKVANELCVNYISFDISDIAETQAKFDELVRDNQIDILINSAGVHCPQKFGEVSEDGWDNVIDINLKGLYFLCQCVGNYMVDNKIKGHILNISSASSLKPSWTPYEISKRAVNGITQGFAHKLTSYGIVVNGLAPGPTATPMLKFSKDEEVDLTWSANPSGRVSTVEEIAELAIFMVSDLGNGIIGDTFFMTGGSGTICIDK